MQALNADTRPRFHAVKEGLLVSSERGETKRHDGIVQIDSVQI